MRNPLEKANSLFFEQLNRVVDWHELPKEIALLNLRAFRDELREANLYDGAPPEVESEGDAAPVALEELPAHRTYDGSLNDPAHPTMGKAGVVFGRNHPLGITTPETLPELMEPNPRVVATALMHRKEFIPATSLNNLAAAWIQFQNHDWFSHGDNNPDSSLQVPLAENDPWGGEAMEVRSTRTPSAPGDEQLPPAYVNTVTHWWDGSQIYGSSQERNQALRSGSGGEMKVEEGRLPEESDKGLHGIDLTGFADNYWLGLSLLHTLFVKEHNAIAAFLRGHYPTWDDEELFLTARLCNSALMAKIHTVEWTPGILATPVLRAAMHANWYGALPAWAASRLPRIDQLEGLFGVVGGEQEHHAAPYAITEEFASVYRLHPLIADDWEIRSHRTGALIAEDEFINLQGHDTRASVDKYGWSDLMYSFGTSHPGAICLHNHPRALANLTRVNGDRVDLATIDVLRDRERGVPRYNDFREKLRKPRIKKFEDISSDPEWCDQIKDVYGDVDAVDLQVGLLAEKPPKGFGFSDTAFRIFILMASRRLKSDRFFTRDFTPEVYTPEGLDWVQKNTMVDVLLRHHPELQPALAGCENAFAPWRAVG
jgi:hypothetical protein